MFGQLTHGFNLISHRIFTELTFLKVLVAKHGRQLTYVVLHTWCFHETTCLPWRTTVCGSLRDLPFSTILDFIRSVRLKKIHLFIETESLFSKWHKNVFYKNKRYKNKIHSMSSLRKYLLLQLTLIFLVYPILFHTTVVSKKVRGILADVIRRMLSDHPAYNRKGSPHDLSLKSQRWHWWQASWSWCHGYALNT